MRAHHLHILHLPLAAPAAALCLLSLSASASCLCSGKSKQDLTRRTSSGNWIEDRVTWKEEMSYKKAMGYI